MVLGEQKKKKILVVDDEPSVRESLQLILSRTYLVESATSGDEALALLEKAEQDASEHGVRQDLPNLVLLDVMMPGIDGIEILKQLCSRFPTIPVIMLTASKTVSTVVEAMKLGAIDYLSKPFDVDELLALVEETLKTAETRVHVPSQTVSSIEVETTEGDFGAMTGKHPVMAELYQKVELLAQRETTILITGESGTGKELIAREIHRRSPRNDKPFIALNCAAIPETLIESELFGHEKGSFTHAVEKRIGHFELADGGTLFLDEIGELSLPVQVKMLRFLQEQEFYRVGSPKPQTVDVRILAATNRSLENAIREGTFRQDLFYRINVVNLEMPPLRVRSGDIRVLVEHFVKKLSEQYAGKSMSLTDAAYGVLEAYSWPGNVRELENVVESLLALSAAELIDVSDLPARLRKREGSSGDLKEQVLDGSIPFEEAERAFETELILRALKQTNFVQTRAAEVLGISRRILKYKMDKLGISDSQESSSKDA